MPKLTSSPVASVKHKGQRRVRTAHLPFEERSAFLRSLLADLKKAGTPSWPADFCKRASIGKRTLGRFPEIAPQVNAYGWQTAPHKMRSSPRMRGNREFGERLLDNPEREHRATGKRLAATMVKLRRDIAELRRDLKSTRIREEHYKEEAASRGRLVEELIARMVTPQNGLREQVEDILRNLNNRRLEQDRL